METLWLTHGKLITPEGLVDGAIHISRGRIDSIRRSAPRSATNRIDLHGAYVTPGFIDLHLWGDPRTVSREAASHGTTAFLTTLGPAAPERLAEDVEGRAGAGHLPGAQCLGMHLEGPFVNPARAGALPKRWMRRPTVRELTRLWRASRGRIKLMTLAPEWPGSLEIIRWCRRRGIVASLGHSEATALQARRAVEAGATAATHIFNGTPPFHHRTPGLLDMALTDHRLMAMVIADGVHVSAPALRLLLRAKGVERVALVTDSIRHQGWDVVKQGGAYYRRDGTLAGSALTMMQAVRNAVRLGGATLLDAVRLASENPARLLGIYDSVGSIEPGKRADLVVFDRSFRTRLTLVAGRVAFQR